MIRLPPETLNAIPPDVRQQGMLAEAMRRGIPVPKAVRQRMLKQEAARRGLVKYKSYEDFVLAHNPTLLQFEHVQLILPTVEKAARHEYPRLMILWPTQYHKSEIWSRLFPAYYLLKYMNRIVALASYGADLAWELSGDARDYYRAAGGQFREGSPQGSTRNWRTLRHGGMSGGMWATGIGGPALGRGYNCGIVDDPIDPEQVERSAYKNRFARWWPSKWLRGQRPHNSMIVLVMQRLGIEDPVEWLWKREGGKTSEHWHIVAFDEVRSMEPFGRYKGPRGVPTTCTVADDPRKVGEVLSPTWRAKDEVQKMQDTAGPVVAAAQRQMRPMRATGDFWKEKFFQDREYETLPAHAYNGGWDWDTAYTADEKNSATAGIKSYRGPGDEESFPIYIEDVLWEWKEFPDAVVWIRETGGPHFVEKKASGKSIVQVLKANQIVADEVLIQGDKLARASAVQPAASVGRVYIRKAIRQKLLLGEQQGLYRVTAEALQEEGAGLDVNDAFVQALHRHLEIWRKGKKKMRMG